MLQEVAKALKAQPAEITEKIAHLQAEVKSLQSENESLKSKLAQGSLGDVMNQVVDVKGVKLLAAKVEGVDMNGLRDLGDQLKEKLGEGVVVLAAVNGRQSKPSCNGYRCSSESRSACWKSDQRRRSDRRRWRRRSSEHGSGRWKESGKGRRSS